MFPGTVDPDAAAETGVARAGQGWRGRDFLGRRRLRGLLAALGFLAFIPLAAVWIMLIAYIVLAAGCLMRGA